MDKQAMLEKSKHNLWAIGPGGIVLCLDVSDPDTPAMVYDSTRKRASATYDCACATGELMGNRTGAGDVILNQKQIDWLDNFADRASDAINAAREGIPEYE